MSFTISNGYADEITLPNSKKYYTGINSLLAGMAERKGLEVKRVKIEGCCISLNVNERAHSPIPYPIKVDGEDIYDFIEKVHDEGENYENSALVMVSKLTDLED